MEQLISCNRPLLKTKGFSTLHIQIFEFILLGKTNREINRMLGYTVRSHVVVDHSKQVMHKLLCYENLCKKEFRAELTYPRRYIFWWRKLLQKHYDQLCSKAIKPLFYIEQGQHSNN